MTEAMRQDTKQRLVGAAVLGALAIIFIPFIFDGSAPERYEVVYDPQPVPEYEPTPLTPEEVEASMRAMAEQSEAAMPRREAADETPAPGFKLDSDQLPVGWTLQLASFKGAANATRLRKRLRDATYQSYVLRKDEIHRVYVGPSLERERLESIAEAIEAEFELKGMVVRYRIEDDQFLVGG